jgi:hypothetical protein
MDSPQRIGKYEILSVLGHGGMGVVYRAQDPRIGRLVAIKTVTAGLSGDAGTLQRFYREAEKMGMLKHPNIITVYDLGEQDGFPYIVMEYVEGDPLDKLIVKEQQLSLTYKLRIVEQVCAALGYAHGHDVIHRDVKPANVIVRPDGLAKLLDFGIARQERGAVDITVTVAGGIIGTVAYMAPERLRGEPLDGRSDIFATGVMLYQLLTGSLPFLGGDIALINRILNEKHRPLSDFLPSYPPALDHILDRALEKNPLDRYQTSDEMAGDLLGVIDTLKSEYSASVIAQAERLVASRDYAGARDVLAQLLRVDNQHMQARRFLSEVNQHLTLQLRTEQAQHKRRQAEDAVQERRYDDAVVLLEEAARSVPEDRSLMDRLVEVRKLKETTDQIMGLLLKADAAKKVGDYKGAQAIVAEALKLDTNNSRLRAAYGSLVRQAEEVASKTNLKSMMDAVRQELSERRFAPAMLLIEQAEKIDPNDGELRSLRDAAQEGLQQEERRRTLDQIDGLMAAASTRGEWEQVAGMLRPAVERYPTDATLLRFQAQAEAEIRHRVQAEAVDAAIQETLGLMEQTPTKALERVRVALAQAPGEDRLLALESSIEERLSRQRAQELRNTVLLQAREALKERRFADAVAVLEQCHGAARTEEVSELLEFARQQSRQQAEERLVAECYAEAAVLQREGRDEALVARIQPVLEQVDDPGLQRMLGDAQRRIEERRAEVAAAMATLQSLQADGCYEQAVAYVEALPERLIGVAEVQQALAAAKKMADEDCRRLDALGRRYAALDAIGSQADASALKTLVWDMELNGASPAVLTVGRALNARRTARVDEVLNAAIVSAQQLAAQSNGQPAAVPPQVDGHVLMLASEAVQGRWRVTFDKPKQGGKLLSKFTGKRK